MNLQRILLTAHKSVLETLREPGLLLFTLLLPAFFMLINYVGYGTSPRENSFPIWVTGTGPNAEALLARLSAEQYANGRPVFAIKPVDATLDVDTALRDGTTLALLTLSSAPDGSLAYTVRGNALSMGFTRASTQLDAVLTEWQNQAQGKPAYARLVERPLGLARPLNDFDAYAPGMMVFAILLLIPQTATLLGREMREGTLNRLALTRLSTLELFGGITLAQMFFAALQVALMFATALALGFHNRGSLGLAVIIGLALAFGAVGMGLGMACFIRNDSDALNTGSSVSMVQVFLSGAFFAFPAPTLFTLAGHTIGLFDILPATHAMLALQQVLVGGADLAQVGFRLAATLILGLIYFAAGALLFRSRMARR
ncbi:MAG: ABC transporter permease [Anaerolineae bacterium]|nr:ABC transporter permease [Anaerolineae bacterium]